MKAQLRTLKLGIAICALAGITSLAHAQSYSIDFWSIDGGGGTSSGGSYTLSGTVGQPDAGKLTGGNYTLEGGFWGVIAAIQTSGMPQLYITNISGTISVYWPLPGANCVLEQTTTLNGNPIPWSDVALPYHTNATSIYVNPTPPTGNTFYRLRRP
jgi:hypothetical protein